uniref:Uncharacterized protein n=1 Tax=Plectus sambesii TaxID=2011161 RepID=A0A914VKB7_9BILA
GVEAPEDAIYLPPDAISGPNLAIEAKLIRFYVVLSDQYVVPMIGRITHVSADSSSEVRFLIIL